MTGFGIGKIDPAGRAWVEGGHQVGHPSRQTDGPVQADHLSPQPVKITVPRPYFAAAGSPQLTNWRIASAVA